MVLEQLVAYSKENSDKLSDLSAVILKDKKHKNASSLSSTEYMQFLCGEFSFDSNMYESLALEPQYNAVYQSLSEFYLKICENIGAGCWKEVDNCQLPTDHLLKAICPLFFTDGTVTCLREYALRLDSTDFTFTSDGKLDHVVLAGRNPEEARGAESE